MKTGTAQDGENAKWTITPPKAKYGQDVKLKYNGRLKVKKVTATTDAAPANQQKMVDSDMKKKVISMLALMITISTSAWAQKEVKLTQTAEGRWELPAGLKGNVVIKVEYEDGTVETVATRGSATGINAAKTDNRKTDTPWYSLDGTEHYFDLYGRPLNGKPNKAGVYVKNGKKIMIK